MYRSDNNRFWDNDNLRHLYRLAAGLVYCLDVLCDRLLGSSDRLL